MLPRVRLQRLPRMADFALLGHSLRKRLSPPRHRESVSQALDRIRRVARHRKKEKFSGLFHHITAQLVREAFFEVKENAAPGVDGLGWGNYEAESGTQPWLTR
jgi:hypothetical protein